MAVKKIKLWKVQVNNWGWDAPRTFFFSSREEAVAFSDQFPAADGVEYAGLYTETNAKRMLGVDEIRA